MEAAPSRASQLSLVNMRLANLPPAIAKFLWAARQRDFAALAAAWAREAIVFEAGKEFRGDAIGAWSERCFGQEGTTIQPINVARRGPSHLLTVVLHRPGGQPEQRDWSFTTADDGITALKVVGNSALDLPGPVAAYVMATNTFDLEALVATFADDALVNDQLREYWGKAAISEWAAREIVGQRLTMYVVKAVDHHGHVVVSANVDGDYDKRGLPDPLVLTFYFSPLRDRIVQLIILRNEPDI